MKLKQIEINGFKSFQSKSVFNIDSNLIGIVGPNGSGKSNIIDAIRWVLGEQSAKNLRGSSMKDVIFSGTEEKKAKNFAEVTISFDMSGQDKIITRRLYKNGDSEYLLDGKKSKLKDITDIYLDLGINKESYSIITQGKVESILSSKSQDRRGIIEEAAGVLKYKNKKRESTLKLEKTQDNINRLKDIFTEIEERYFILSEQKDKTEKYLLYTETLKEKDIDLQVYNINSYRSDVSKSNSLLNQYQDEKRILEKNILALEEDIIKNKDDIQKKDIAYSEAKEKEILIVEEIGKLNSTIRLLEEKTNNSVESKNKISNDISTLENRKEALITNKNKEKIEIDLLRNDLKQIDKKIVELNKNSQVSVEDIELIIEDLKNEYFSLVNLESKLENDIEFNNKINKNKDQNLSIIKDEIARISLSLKKEENIEDDLYKASKKLKSKVEELSKESSFLGKEISKYTKKRNDLLEKISNGKNLLQTNLNKKDFLENQYAKDNYYNVGVREVISQRKNIKGIHDVVANVIKIENQYAVALDLALSSSQQNIIVDSPETARLCVEHLKEKNKGRATFLPLSSIKKREMDKNIISQLKDVKGFIDLAVNLVVYDIKYHNVVSNLLGLVIISDNLYNANIIAKKVDYKYKIITLDGNVINSGGSISGGATYKSTNSLIKIKAELMDLSSNIDKISSKIEELEKELVLVDKDLIASKNKETDKISILQIKEKEYTELKIKHNISKENIMSLKNTLENQELQLSNLEENYENKDEAIIYDQLKSIRLDLENISIRIEEEQSRKNNLSVQNNILIEKINDLKLNKSRLIESLKYKEEFVNKNNEDIDYINTQIAKLTNDLKIIDDKLFSSETIDVYKQDIIRLDKDLLSLKSNITNLSAEKENLFLKDTEYNKEHKRLYDSLGQINNNLEKVRIKLSKLEVKIDDIISYLNSNYSITYEKAVELSSKDDIDFNSYKDIVRDLKNKIKLLGNVNLNAIDEFVEVEERYNFYKVEIDDLVSSKYKLESTIKEIDNEVKERFITTFNKVSDNFTRIFRELFRGGNARIILENPENILETGIDIEASPPGKKLQKISLLSGGEKSLTAISLLFAILEIKNSPFVVLDEVEAALDDVNVSRFAKFLKIYSKENQFLVITHRRGTMEEMDKLYGITMKEKGISYILSLDLNTILQEEFINE